MNDAFGVKSREEEKEKEDEEDFFLVRVFRVFRG